MLGAMKSEQKRWRPKSLFLVVLKQAIQRLSNGGTLDDIRTQAATEFMEKAARPGLDVHGEPFVLASDFTAILQTVLTRVHACLVPSLKPGPSVVLADGITWSSRVLADPTGALHSWIAVESYTQQVLSKELHGWHVTGEIAATGMPMTLHVIEVGRQSGSHQHTPWCKAYAHPAIKRRFGFQQRGGVPLAASWKPVFYQDSSRNDPDTWVEMMARDEVVAHHDVPVRAIRPDQAKQTCAEMVVEARRMEALLKTDWRDEPKRRTACDMPPCIWQTTCYSS